MIPVYVWIKVITNFPALDDASTFITKIMTISGCFHYRNVRDTFSVGQNGMKYRAGKTLCLILVANERTKERYIVVRCFSTV